MQRIVVDGNALASKTAAKIRQLICEHQLNHQRAHRTQLTHTMFDDHRLTSTNNLSENIDQFQQSSKCESENSPAIEQHFRPQLDIINIGCNTGSLSYIIKKIKLAASIGIAYHLHHFDAGLPTSDTDLRKFEKIFTNISTTNLHRYSLESLSPQNQITQIRTLIHQLNNSPHTSGILLQLPLPTSIKPETEELLEEIILDKDVDCLTLGNKAKLLDHRSIPYLMPCTPSGVLRILDEYEIDVSGMNTVMIGRSALVGMPLAHLLMGRNATVTVCHHLSTNVSEMTKTSELVISATGVSHLVKELKPGGISIDVGISRDEQGKLSGDICEMAKECSYLSTPVPGGVGPMTVAMLMENAYKLWIKKHPIYPIEPL